MFILDGFIDSIMLKEVLSNVDVLGDVSIDGDCDGDMITSVAGVILNTDSVLLKEVNIVVSNVDVLGDVSIEDDDGVGDAVKYIDMSLLVAWSWEILLLDTFIDSIWLVNMDIVLGDVLQQLLYVIIVLLVEDSVTMIDESIVKDFCITPVNVNDTLLTSTVGVVQITGVILDTSIDDGLVLLMNDCMHSYPSPTSTSSLRLKLDSATSPLV